MSKNLLAPLAALTLSCAPLTKPPLSTGTPGSGADLQEAHLVPTTPGEDANPVVDLRELEIGQLRLCLHAQRPYQAPGLIDRCDAARDAENRCNVAAVNRSIKQHPEIDPCKKVDDVMPQGDPNDERVTCIWRIDRAYPGTLDAIKATCEPQILAHQQCLRQQITNAGITCRRGDVTKTPTFVDFSGN